MQLDMKGAAALFSVSEKTLSLWIKTKKLPSYQVNGQYWFNRAELLEWATEHKVALSGQIIEAEKGGAPVRLDEALRLGGIFHDIGGTDKASVLNAVVDVMNLPPEVDRTSFCQLLLARESLGTTAIGDGIAIPHARHPIVLHTSHPTVTLCFLENPIDFGADDGRPVDILFTLVCPTVRGHQQLLAALALGLKDGRFRSVLTRKASGREILEEAERVSEQISAQMADSHH
ncbi:MAG: PTS sugar transporter subunit IIA [Syntrophobacteraceae bacterium]|nr:PTS sugar transporter subunit IIA [Syntrophobacteraceae bacterium]